MRGNTHYGGNTANGSKQRHGANKFSFSTSTTGRFAGADSIGNASGTNLYHDTALGTDAATGTTI